MPHPDDLPRTPPPGTDPDDAEDATPALDDDPAAWVAPAPGTSGEVPASGDDR